MTNETKPLAVSEQEQKKIDANKKTGEANKETHDPQHKTDKK